MDNRGIRARVNSRLSQIRRYVAYHRIEVPSECWPFGAICEYTDVMGLSCRVPLSNRRGKRIVEAPEPSSRRINTEAENVADENNRAIPIVISSGSEDDSDDGAAYEEAVRREKGKTVAHEIPKASKAEPKQNGKPAAQEIPLGIVIREQENGKFVEHESESETDSEDDADNQRRLNVAIWKSLNTPNVEAPESSTRREAENVVDENNLGAEHDRQLQVAILESLNAHTLRREHELLKEGVTGSESVAAEGTIGNDSASNPVMELANVSHCPNDDSVDEGAQVEAVDAVRGKFINSSGDSDDSGRIISNIEPTELTESMPRPPVSSRGRPLKPTLKLIELSNATGAPLPSKRKRKDGASIGRQTKQKAVKPTPAVKPRGFLRRQGVAGVSEPSGSHSVLGQASLANGMARQADVVNPNGSGTVVEVGVSEPSGSGSLGGQASEVNEVGRQTDMAAPSLEPMVCVTSRNPMDLTIEEAKKYPRSENRVSSTQKVKLFGTYIS